MYPGDNFINKLISFSLSKLHVPPLCGCTTWVVSSLLLLQITTQWVTSYTQHFCIFSLNLWMQLLEVGFLGQRVNAYVIWQIFPNSLPLRLPFCNPIGICLCSPKPGHCVDSEVQVVPILLRNGISPPLQKCKTAQYILVYTLPTLSLFLYVKIHHTHTPSYTYLIFPLNHLKSYKHMTLHL